MTLQTAYKIQILLLTVLVSGCGSNPKKVIFDKDNPTMESILQGNTKGSLTYTDKAHGREESLAHNSTNHLNQNVFRELDNPTLFLYIEPHVTKGGTYLPGMTVPYKQYNKVEFALPGEL